MCIISLGEGSNIEHIDYKPSRRFSAVGSAYQGTVSGTFTSTMTSGSSADTTMTFGGGEIAMQREKPLPTTRWQFLLIRLPLRRKRGKSSSSALKQEGKIVTEDCGISTSVVSRFENKDRRKASIKMDDAVSAADNKAKGP